MGHAHDRWRQQYARARMSGRLREAEFRSHSGEELDPVYGPPQGEPPAAVGWPGAHPFTRGLHATGYRGRLWTIRQFAGFGSAALTNERFHEILASGGGGLSVAFDLPTLMGRDSDDPLARGEVGHCGVAIDSVADLEVLFAGIPLDRVTTSLTISGPAVPMLAMLVVAAERQGVGPGALDATLQSDILKEYIAQKEWLFSPEPHLRLIGDMMQWTAAHAPRIKPLSVSGYHIREAGATAAQELALTLADGFGYVELGLARGLDVDEAAAALTFFFDAHIDLFEEVAKFRAARRLWARWMRDRYGATQPRSQWLRFHTQTAGVSLTAQQPENNIVRTTIEALAAVLGGTNSLHTNALDEVLALPSQRAARIALRTQQVIAEETGIAHVADPLGGSWYVEAMTDRMEAQAEDLLAQILARGRARHPDGDHPIGPVMSGLLAGIESGWFTGMLADAAYAHQRAVEEGRLPVVGVTTHTDSGPPDVALLRIPAEVETEQVADLAGRRVARDDHAVGTALEQLAAAARGDANLVPLLLAAARVEATLGEMCAALRSVWGSYREPV